MKRLTWLVPSLALLLTRPAPAQDAPTAQQVEEAFRVLRAAIAAAKQPGQGEGALATSSYTDEELTRLLQKEGYGAIETLAEGRIKFAAQGNNHLLIRYDDGDLQLYTAFRSGGQGDYKKVNQWNRTKRLSRAYVDNDGDYCIEADLLSNGGLNDEKLKAFLRVFVMSAQQFQQAMAK